MEMISGPETYLGQIAVNKAALAMTEEEATEDVAASLADELIDHPEGVREIAQRLITRWKNGVGTDDPEFTALIPIEDLEALCGALKEEAVTGLPGSHCFKCGKPYPMNGIYQSPCPCESEEGQPEEEAGG